jgi:hypothetical protein
MSYTIHLRPETVPGWRRLIDQEKEEVNLSEYVKKYNHLNQFSIESARKHFTVQIVNSDKKVSEHHTAKKVFIQNT